MNNKNKNYRSDLTKNYILWGILFISLFSSLMHFLYELSGKSVIVGIFVPVNESVWEHLKLHILPTIIWWLISYFKLKKKMNISYTRWFISFLISLMLCPLIIVTFHYTYKGAIGFGILFLDIFSLFLGIAIGQLTALLFYHYGRFKRYHVFIAVIIFIIFIVIFVTFTFVPPHYPLFKDSTTGKYGI